MELKPLNEKIGKLVDKFLDDKEYYDKFEGIAQTNNIISDNPEVIKMSMFSTQGNELIFVTNELENLFLEWQLFIQLIDHEPYATLITKFPERKPQIMNMAHRLLEGKEVSNDDITNLFKGLDDD